MKRYLVISVVALAMASGAQAAVIMQYSYGNVTGTTLDLYVTDLDGTNGGIQNSSVKFSAGSGGDINNFSFAAAAGLVGLDGATVVGFNSQLASVAGSYYNVVAAQTGLDNPAKCVFGIGLDNPAVHAGASLSIADPMLIGTLTFDGATPIASILDGNVFDARAAKANSVLASGTEVVWVPEPMTMMLLGVGGLALIRRRRK